MFKRQPAVLAQSTVARSSCSLHLTQELIIPSLLIADLFVRLGANEYMKDHIPECGERYEDINRIAEVMHGFESRSGLNFFRL